MNEELLKKYITGDYLTDDERYTVVGWLEESPENMNEYKTLHKIYDTLLWNEQEENSNILPEVKHKSKSIKRQLITLSRYAAVFFIAVLGCYVFLTYSNTSETVKTGTAKNTVFVPPGQRAEITLTDGTKVWLNAGTRFIYPEKFDTDHRDVYLDGEAYFEVEKDGKRPFTVRTDKYNVKVLGTEFNLIAYKGSDLFETSLLQGSVEVKSHDEKSSCVLSPNNIAYAEGGKLKTAPLVDKNYLLWKEGIIYFDNETVLEIMKKLELYFDIKIDVQNKSIIAYRYSGKFRTKDGVEQVLKVLQLKHKFNYTRDDSTNTITVL
jgi:ferric-dicitrate binding protein FerR (iron transport regulator)